MKINNLKHIFIYCRQLWQYFKNIDEFLFLKHGICDKIFLLPLIFLKMEKIHDPKKSMLEMSLIEV